MKKALLIAALAMTVLVGVSDGSNIPPAHGTGCDGVSCSMLSLRPELPRGQSCAGDHLCAH